MQIKYFDHAATTQIRKEVLDEMMPYLDNEFGNPSSMHIKGTEAKKAVSEAREKIANGIGAKADEIYFTSGGSEADNLAIKGFAKANKKKGRHIITSKIEHKAILETCHALEEEGFDVTYLDVDHYGRVKLEELEKAIREDTILISIMFANNEIGTLQPIKEIGKIARKHKVPFHTDAVQVIGNIKIDVDELQIDMLSMSSHKFYGPKGIGALYVRNGLDFASLIHGGGQEKGKRAGTENVANIVGMGKAIELANKNLEKYNQKLEQLSQTFLNEIKKEIPNAKLNGHPLDRLKGNVSISFKNIDAESLILLLSEKGFCISAASACSSNTRNISHVLKAIGLSDDESKGTIRITFGEENTIKDVKQLVGQIVDIIRKLEMM